MRILISEMIAEKGTETLKKAPGVTVDIKDRVPREELLEIIGDYDALIVRSYTKVDEALYERAHNLKVVGRAGNGIDNIDMDGATKRGIIVVNTPDANSVSAAELTVGHLIGSSRYIPQGNDRMKRERVWSRKDLQGVELLGKTLGIIGLGRIGALVATRMLSFGMKVIAYDPYINDARFKKFGAEKKETLAELMAEADFLTIHTPKTEETYGMIGINEFHQAKPGLRVVNCARGGLINENALVEAINEGTVATAGIDVLVDEPGTTSPLLDCNCTIVTPHVGATTVEAQDNVGVSVALEVLQSLNGELVANAVNLPVIGGHELNAIRSYLSLGEILGKLYHQLRKDPVEKVELVYSGEVAQLETTTITLAVLKGLFETVLHERVNYVNAQLIAETRGVAVTESKKSAVGDYLNLIRLKIISGGKIFTVSGTVFGKDELRIVELNGFQFDVNPTPYMLVAENSDTPGMIGQIGTLLGASKINIATMQVSRNHLGDRAMMFLTIDSEVPKEFLGLIAGVEGIFQVKFVRL